MENDRDEILRRIIREALDDPHYTEARKRILKEAISEWLDSQWAEFGKWTFRGLYAALLVGALYLYGRAKGIL